MCKDEEEKEMATAVKEETDKLNFMDDIKKIIRDTMNEKGLSPKEARKSLGVKKYEEK
ncbi:hypothetical protein [Siminovitchia fordii]|uniref:Uncharacterized protein n=1 Tax=Siminovitchia fordii TaxID=254759 RepID=A0ABQ4KDC8_9BACI|nr:hypothetical protein [Siminovitchia fordii]GIN23120.1 hypothetical protein J1TS3_42540 [Siminovitchia fordii]